MTRHFGKGIRVGVRRFFVPATRDPSRARADLRAELDAHIEARVEYLVARGMPTTDAHAEANARFRGGLDRVIDTLQSSAVERERQLGLRERLASIVQDARFVLRGLRRTPAFTIGAIATLGLGLGINSAVFRVADRVLVRAPTGVGDPWALRRVNTVVAFGRRPPTEGSTMSYPAADRIVGSHAFVRAGMYATARGLRSAGGRDIPSMYVDSGFFSVLGLHPAAGRFFDASEAAPGAQRPVIVVSFDFWHRELGAGNPSSGLTTKINDRTYQVIGVTPSGFTGIDLDPVDAWIPFGVADLGGANINGTPIPWYRTEMLRAIRVIGRVAPGITDARVAAQAGGGVAGPTGDMSIPIRSVVLRSIVAPRDNAGNDTPNALIGRLAGVAVVVLLIACANAANLLLARALRRRREIAVRLALGAARVRLVRLLVVESVMLGVAGGAAAALGGYWTGNALRHLIFPDAKWTTAAFDDRSLMFTLLAALIAGLAAGLAPALQLTNPDLVSALKDNRHEPGRRSHHTRAALVVIQTAFSLALVIASGLLLRSLVKLNAVNLGFSPDGLVTAEIGFAQFATAAEDPKGWAARGTATALAQIYQRAPNVSGVALASNAPFGSHASMSVSVPGVQAPDESAIDGPWYSVVSPTFFQVMGTRLLSGRSFNDSDDRGGRPVAIVNTTMARLFWPDVNPAEHCLLVRNACAQVVGIVEDIRDARSGGPPPPRYYLPLAQQDDAPAAVVLRTSESHAATIAGQLKASVPSGQRSTVEMIADRVGRAMRPWRMATILFATLGIVALILACVGVYSVMSYIASERVHELGVRIVLGATAGDIVTLVLMRGMRLIATGLALGVAAAALSARLLASLLFGVSPVDPLVFGTSVLILAATGTIAALIPALRVVGTDPTIALRSD